MNQSIQIISIEGNIGSGKSTLLANLKNHFSNKDGNTTSDNSINNIIFLKEPVDEWSNIKDENGVTILEKFYADQYKYSFSFQMMAYISRLKLLRDTIRDIQRNNSDTNQNTHYTIITERSLYTDKMVFAKMLHDDGVIEDIDYQIYNMFYNEITKQPEVKQLSGVIYINAEPEVSFERTKIRARDGESTITLGYLKECHAYHEKWIGDKKQADLNYPVLNINANGLISEEQINSIFEFIHRFQ